MAFPETNINWLCHAKYSALITFIQVKFHKLRILHLRKKCVYTYMYACNNNEKYVMNL